MTPHVKLSVYRILVHGNPTAARALIEARLGVETTTEPSGDGRWAIYFNQPPGTPGVVDLDFLRPDVLEP